MILFSSIFGYLSCFNWFRLSMISKWDGHWLCAIPDQHKGKQQYRLIHKYMCQPRTQISGLWISQEIIFREWALECQADRIDFNSAIDSIIIFSSSNFKYINETFKISMIREWLSDFFIMKDLMLMTLHRDFRHSLSKMLMHFKWSNSRLTKQVTAVKTSMMRIAWEDLLLVILIRKFWIYWTNLFLNWLDR
jgi:hypothetical protein